MTKLEWLVNRILSFSQSVHVTYKTMTKLKWLVNRILSFSQSVHTTYETLTKLEWLVNHILSFSQSIHAMYETMTKLEWLVNRILSFLQSVHTTYETMTDFSQCGARSGSPHNNHTKLIPDPVFRSGESAFIVDFNTVKKDNVWSLHTVQLKYIIAI